MENRAQNVSKKALKVNKVLAMITAFAIGLGAFCVPMTTFAFSGGAHGSINNTEIYTYNLDLDSLTYVTGYDLGGDSFQPLSFYGKNTVLPTYRVDQVLGVWVSLPITLVEGDYVDVELGFRFSTGTFIQSWSSFNNGFTFSHSDTIWTSNEISSSNYVYGTDSSGGSSYVQTLRAFNISSDGTNFFRFCYRLNPKSSTDVFFEFTSITITVYREKTWDDSQIKFEENQQEQITQSKNIFEVIGNLWSGIVNLPSNIKSALSSLFTNVQNAVNNVGTGVTNLPVNIKSALTSLFANLQTAVGNVSSGVVNGLSGVLDNIRVAVNAVGASVALALEPVLSGIEFAVNAVSQQIYDRFSTYIAQWGELFSILTDRSSFGDISGELSGIGSDVEESIGSIVPLDKPSFDELPNIEDYVPSTDSYFIVLMRRLFEREHILFLSAMALAFGVTGYLLYGKR